MKLKEMTDLDLFNMVREQIVSVPDYKIPPHIAREVKRRKRTNPDAFDFLKPPLEPKYSVRLSLRNREMNIILGDLYSTISSQRSWLQEHPDSPTAAMVEARMNERQKLYEKLNARTKKVSDAA